MKVTILGVRGSIPTDGPECCEFGGATSCILVEAGGQAIYLDAGSGLLRAPNTGTAEVSILITHSHMDHILGLPLSPILLSNKSLDLYLAKRSGISAKGQLERLMAPPLWPVGVEQYPAEVIFHDLELPMQIGEVQITGMESNHPGGSTIFRLDYGGHSLVYATDYEHTEEKQKELIAFAQGTDLLLYDAQYTEEEYARMKGFGHSTIAAGMQVFTGSGAKRILFVHHDPRHPDVKLREMEAELEGKNAALARAGEVIIL